MPKQIWKIEQFHGGINSNSDPRDLSPSESPSLQDISVDSIGRMKTMGKWDSGNLQYAQSAGYSDNFSTRINVNKSIQDNIKRTKIVDEFYNASPALEPLKVLPTPVVIFIPARKPTPVFCESVAVEKF